jgi:hypothetical protein
MRFVAVDDGVDADDLQGTASLMRWGRPATAGFHEGDPTEVDHDARADMVGNVQDLSELVSVVVVDLSGQSQHTDAVRGVGHDRRSGGLMGIDILGMVIIYMIGIAGLATIAT